MLWVVFKIFCNHLQITEITDWDKSINLHLNISPSNANLILYTISKQPTPHVYLQCALKNSFKYARYIFNHCSFISTSTWKKLEKMSLYALPVCHEARNKIMAQLNTSLKRQSIKHQSNKSTREWKRRINKTKSEKKYLFTIVAKSDKTSDSLASGTFLA